MTNLRKLPGFLPAVLSLLTLMQPARAQLSPAELDPDGAAKETAFQLPDGVRAELIAASPQLQLSIGMSVDRHNRIYVAEFHRLNRGVEENRNRRFLLSEDLKSQTIEDRLNVYRRHLDQFGGSMDYFTQSSDRVVRLEDRDHDGKIDTSTVFADDFRDPLSGLGNDVLVQDGTVWYTNAPDLWRLTDEDGDGVADKRESLLRGFCPQNAFVGHGLHGLVQGPDGKLYFSVGDRGYHVETDDGAVWHGPRQGAVFRCAPDGSEFEVLFDGLRNPEDLAFDNEGNLFTTDNNCDLGDYSRLVYVVEGGHGGWNMSYQTMQKPYQTGPWHAEGIWHVPAVFQPGPDATYGQDNPLLKTTRENGNAQPAWIVPPVGAVGIGPSGMVCHPGTGPFADWTGDLLMGNSQVNLEAYRVEPKAAGFRIIAAESLCSPAGVDVEFTFDGRLLFNQLVDMVWETSSGGGRIYAISDEKSRAEGRSLAKLAAQDFRLLDEGELWQLLSHNDRRMRQQAQFTLAERGAEGARVFAEVLSNHTTDRYARLHALWGLGQCGPEFTSSWKAVEAALTDDDPVFRAQAASVIGWNEVVDLVPQLVDLLEDADPCVQRMAAETLGKLADTSAVVPLFALLRRNADADPILRHSACFALHRLGAHEAAFANQTSDDRSERMAAVLVLRHGRDSRLAAFLVDSDLAIVTEAARAINDLPLESAMPQLAGWNPPDDIATVPEALWRRVINACYRMGEPRHVARVISLASDDRLSDVVRTEALSALEDWSVPDDRDRVTGFWRPLAPRDPRIVRNALALHKDDLPDLLPPDLRSHAIRVLAASRLQPSKQSLQRWLNPDSSPVTARTEAARLMSVMRCDGTETLLPQAVNDASAVVRIAARAALVRWYPDQATSMLATSAFDDSAELAERQACLRMLGGLQQQEADDLLATAMTDLEAGSWPENVTLDLLDAARERPGLAGRVMSFESARAARSAVARFEYLLAGGDASQGKQVFFDHLQAQCARCHRIGLNGGTAGPAMDGVAARHPQATRRFLLESMLDPNAQLAKGFEQTVILLDNGQVLSGRVTDETDNRLTVELGDGSSTTVEKSQIEERRRGISPMPVMSDVLTQAEIRDLIEFLATLP